MTMAVSDIETQDLLKSIDAKLDSIATIMAKNANVAENATISKMESVQDKFAEQRKWIGCVCRFWFDNPNDTVLDYLGKIQTGKNGIEYYGKETYDWFPHCEPILPTDNAIYKGGERTFLVGDNKQWVYNSKKLEECGAFIDMLDIANKFNKAKQKE